MANHPPESEPTATIAVNPPDAGKEEPNLLAPEIHLVILTWITFFALLAILYRFAWRPILAGLDRREETIRRSLEEADKVHKEYAEISQARDLLMQEAREKAKEIIDQSRQAAVQAANVIGNKAKEETKILLDNARWEINHEKEKVEAELRKVSAEIAVQLAGKIIAANLDERKNKELVDRFLKEL